MLKAGKYYVGDLCYVFNDDDWDNVCKLIIDVNECAEGEFNLADGRRFAIYNTAYGDGEYEDQDWHHYSVDSGSIGCTLVENISADKYNDLNRIGRIVEFKEPFEVYKDQGMICVGHIHIETNDTYEDREDDEVFDDWDKE